MLGNVSFPTHCETLNSRVKNARLPAADKSVLGIRTGLTPVVASGSQSVLHRPVRAQVAASIEHAIGLFVVGTVKAPHKVILASRLP